MKGSDYFVIILSFVSGIFAGVYFYTTVFAPEYGMKDDVLDVASTDFLLSGEMYGGCQRSNDGCPVFTLSESRGYTYTKSYTEAETEGVVVRGRLAADRYDALVDATMVANIDVLTREGGRCVSQGDGTDYRYRLIVSGEEYFLDTCGTQFTQSALARQFEALWPVLAVPTPVQNDILGEGIDGYLESVIDGWFSYDDK